MVVILDICEICMVLAAMLCFCTSWDCLNQFPAFDWNLAAGEDMFVLSYKLELTRVIDTTAFWQGNADIYT